MQETAEIFDMATRRKRRQIAKSMGVSVTRIGTQCRAVPSDDNPFSTGEQNLFDRIALFMRASVENNTPGASAVFAFVFRLYFELYGTPPHTPYPARQLKAADADRGASDVVQLRRAA